ncbi:MAG: leucine-rich repeat protein [Clostridia bacterium]|nr:leucine-rich repeat protein [Clostridia bacterium]
MKKLRLLLIFSFIVLSLVAFASCDKTEVLDTPTELFVENATLQLNWKKVPEARLYTISITKEGEEPREVIASKNYYSLTSLTEGNYTIKVKANGKEGISRDSGWSASVSFEREKENGMVFTLINGKTAYEVTGKGTATGDVVIPDLYRGLPVTSIGKKAFFNKSDITGVTIGENVKSIGEYAFANCSYITSVNLPKGLTYIGESAFASCRLLAGELTIPDGVGAILKNTFAYCGSLEQITFGSNVTRIEASAFTDCARLTSVTMPQKLEFVGALAFAKCKGISSLVLNEGLTEIDDYAFSELAMLTAVVIPDSVNRIGAGAFYLCSELENVTLGNGISVIDDGAFRETKLWNANSEGNEIYVGKWLVGYKSNTVSTLSIKEDTVGIASFAFFGNTGIMHVEIPDSVKIIGEGAFGQSKIMSVIIGGGVREIGVQAFVACEELADVILGKMNTNVGDYTTMLGVSVLETIGDSAFRGCSKLEKIEMPSSLKTVGSYAFRDTDMYNSANGVVYAGNWVVDYNESIGAEITFKDNTVGIANYAFYNCNTITAVQMPNSVKTVGRAAFYDCSSLAFIELPPTLEVIQDYTFYRCKNLIITSLPPMLTYIGRSAFYKCGSSASLAMSDTTFDILQLPGGVTYIGDYAFYCCGYSERAALEEEQYFNTYGIDAIVLGQSVEYIGANAFYGFVSLKEVDLGGTKYIGEKAFYKCESLEKVDFGDSLIAIGEKAFYKCEALQKIELPATVSEIGNYAFYRCEALKAVSLGNVQKIGSFAFYGDSAITNILLPQSVSYIGKQAFRNCKGLTAVILSGNIETVEQHAFYGCPSLTVYVDFTEQPINWHKYWNSSYRPVVYGCVLSEDATYVLYVEKGTIANLNLSNSLSDPIKEGYTFVGWGNSSTTNVPAFTSANLSEADSGRKLYAIWAEEQK